MTDSTQGALILAAGRGRRMGDNTELTPKPLTKLFGRPLLDWQIGTLRQTNIDRFALVTGYRRDMFQPYTFDEYHNPEWETTNMVVSLMRGDPFLIANDYTIVAYGDILYEPRVLNAALTSSVDKDIVVTVDRSWLKQWQLRFDNPLQDAETLNLDENARILNIGQQAQSLTEIDGQYIGMIRVSRNGWDKLKGFFLEAPECPDWANGRSKAQCYLTDLLHGIIQAGEPVYAAVVEGGWIEVDRAEDLSLYERMFANGSLGSLIAIEAIGQ